MNAPELVCPGSGVFHAEESFVVMYFSRRTLVSGILGATLVPTVTSAQSDSSELLHQIPGLESAYGRRYAPADDLSWGDFPVEPTEQTPHYMLIMALTFESELMLRGVMSSLLNGSIAGMILGRSGNDLNETSLPTLPDGNILYFNEDESEGHPYASLLVVPVGNVGYLINSEGDDAALQVTANAVGEFLAEAEPGDAPVTVKAEGVAVGGPFDAMPGTEDLELLNGLVPLFDYDLLVSDSPILPPGATPEASPAS